MNKLLRPKIAMAGCFAFSCLLCGVLLPLVGCGRSDSPGTAVVSPPPPTAIEDEGPSDDNSRPSGGLQLPPGEIPAPGTDQTPESEGIQMPPNADIPLDPVGEGVEGGDENLDASAAPKVKYGTWEEIENEAKSSGRVTVVDLWSLACEPCLKEFPGLVQIHQSLGSSVQCIAVDVDFDGRKSRPPQYYEERVLAFLGSVGATGFPTYISQTPSDDVFAATRLASIPAVLIYNADGEILKVFVDAGDTIGFSYEKDIIPLVTKLAG